jgi:hypothetical protein
LKTLKLSLPEDVVEVDDCLLGAIMSMAGIFDDLQIRNLGSPRSPPEVFPAQVAGNAKSKLGNVFEPLNVRSLGNPVQYLLGQFLGFKMMIVFELRYQLLAKLLVCLPGSRWIRFQTRQQVLESLANSICRLGVAVVRPAMVEPQLERMGATT